MVAAMMPPADPLDLRLSDGVTLAVPANLASVTTYVVLEQETWFEKELRFVRRWLQPGMNAIDIGANLGIYSLPMAQLVGPRGRVIAFEPGSEPRGLLERSRTLNSIANLEIVAAALSDGRREGRLVFGTSSEGNALGVGGAGESVAVTSLDIENGERNWPAPDFVKIDAEGEEDRVLAGGRDLFAKHSPLVMIEVGGDEKTSARFASTFAAMGYRLLRQLGGEPMLVAFDAASAPDRYEVNLFAAKADRMQSLMQQGLLVAEMPPWTPGAAERERALTVLKQQAFAPALGKLLTGAGLDPDYRDALAAYNVWRSPSAAPAVRCAALSFALTALRQLCAQKPTAARTLTYARAAWDFGARAESFKVVQAIGGAAQAVTEPFWPPCPRYDRLHPGTTGGAWLSCTIAEHAMRAGAFSSMFVDSAPALPWLNQQPFACAETLRRQVLMAARAGARPRVPPPLCRQAVEHLNADIWRSGRVPGTVT
jgi:FkbM family methyltransferase